MLSELILAPLPSPPTATSAENSLQQARERNADKTRNKSLRGRPPATDPRDLESCNVVPHHLVLERRAAGWLRRGLKLFPFHRWTHSRARLRLNAASSESEAGHFVA